ncbi:MAG TPA: M14 family zinc carboxypeptidase [Planctomycetota bacterium]|nr:M14 family zinc carboxypeptidase [Planctomycetota bacterium]
MRRSAFVFAAACLAAPAQITPRDVDPGALLEAAATRPACRIETIGATTAGRPLRSALTALPGDVAAESRPRLFVVAGLQGDQAAAMAVAGRLPGALLDLAERDPERRRLLETCAVEVVPIVALDAALAARDAPRRAWRSNLRPIDDDRDGLVDEDGPQDLDGDGVVAWMRLRDPLGPYREAPEDARALVKADPAKGEVGGWRLEPEGLDDDGDGAIDEDGPGGVDVDRNFPHGWKEFDREAGPTPVSEPETRALVERLLAAQSCAAVLVLGRRDNLVEAPPGNNEAKFFPAVENEDRPWFEEAVKRRKERLGFEKKLDDPADGALHQWVYAHLGVFAAASKVYEPPKPAEAESLPSGKKPSTDETRRLLDSDRRLEGKGFAPWKPFRHPTLGDVEIGGFVPGADAPTADELDALVEKHAAFVFDLLALMPRFEVLDAKATPLGPGLYEVTAVVRNAGRTPTTLRVGARTRARLPARVEIDLPRDRFELGEPRTQLEPFGPAGGGRKLRWIVRAAEGEEAVLRLVSPNAGAAAARIAFAGAPK